MPSFGSHCAGKAAGALANLNELNITLRLIDAPVVASGAASGLLEGRIKALFYRYKSVGGYDYVADFLIGPRRLESDDDQTDGRTASPQTQPGDSGAVWHLVTHPEGSHPESPDQAVLRPLCVQWGGQVFAHGADKERFAFALATSLTSVCQALDVELVVEHNTGVRPYWGQTGHYSIASFAADALPPAGKLQGFIKANIERISFRLGELDPNTITQRIRDAKEQDDFVPLADVPDIVWKNFPSKVKGGRDDARNGFRPSGPEHPGHYADIDEPRPSDHKTLRQLVLENPANLSVAFWASFYDGMNHDKQNQRGLLPFRVWQFFDAMVDAAKVGNSNAYLCAAGVLAHYVGDACQPLHGSRFADGYADRPTTVVVHHRDGTVTNEDSHEGAGVHSTFETAMIDRFSEQIVAGIPKQLGHGPALPAISSGRDAAMAIVRLMDRSATAIPPTDLVDTYIAAGGKNRKAVQEALWAKFGQETIDVMADGARVLAKIWQGAWTAGNGEAIAKTKLGPVSEAALMALYRDKKFVESLDLDHIGPKLK